MRKRVAEEQEKLESLQKHHAEACQQTSAATGLTDRRNWERINQHLEAHGSWAVDSLVKKSTKKKHNKSKLDVCLQSDGPSLDGTKLKGFRNPL